jgi:hypothetical protein
MNQLHREGGGVPLSIDESAALKAVCVRHVGRRFESLQGVASANNVFQERALFASKGTIEKLLIPTIEALLR